MHKNTTTLVLEAIDKSVSFETYMELIGSCKRREQSIGGLGLDIKTLEAFRSKIAQTPSDDYRILEAFDFAIKHNQDQRILDNINVMTPNEYARWLVQFNYNAEYHISDNAWKTALAYLAQDAGDFFDVRCAVVEIGRHLNRLSNPNWA